MLTYVRADPTLTGFRLLTALLACSKANTKRPKKYNRKRCSFSTASTMKDKLLVLKNDIRVALQTDKKEKEKKQQLETFCD